MAAEIGASRRELLRTASAGFGYLALAGLAARAADEANTADDPAVPASTQPLAPKASHFPPRAKRVIFLCMQGGPSHVDTFDYKPRLKRDEGRIVPAVQVKVVAVVLVMAADSVLPTSSQARL